MSGWTEEKMASQAGKTILITGANTGTGFETARMVAAKGADVVLACRSTERGDAACAKIVAETPDATVQNVPLDLGDHDNVAGFPGRLGDAKLDVLVNNAGIMIPPFAKTSLGFESQFGVNYVGHFALTGLLLDRLMATPQSRVVTVSSIAHKRGRLDFENLRGEKPYSAWREYSQSKLADLVFAKELQRRLAAAGSEVRSIAAHPGVARTELTRHSKTSKVGVMVAGHSAAAGARSIAYAATEDLEGGSYVGPTGISEMRGDVGPAKVSPQADDLDAARRLWEVAVEATGVRYEALDGTRVSGPKIA